MPVATHPLLEVLSDLVVELELLLEVVLLFVFEVVVGRGRDGRLEKVEERVGRDDLFDDPGLVRVCAVSHTQPSAPTLGEYVKAGGANALLFRCFLVSSLTVRSLPSFHAMSVPSARSYTKSPPYPTSSW